jgi:uncharacterized protein (TIGR01777 family)
MQTIAISGASGLVGTALTALLRERGVRVRPLVRPGKQAQDGIPWDPAGGTVDAQALDGLDALVHLAGDGIADGRWTEAKKARIKDSRVRGTALLASAIARSKAPPKVWLSCSAIGIYGDRGADEVDDDGRPGSDFLSGVAQAWEAAADPVAQLVRVVHPRLGIVLAAHGGALQKMALPFKLGVGGKLGSGAQGVSWVSLRDTARALVHMIEHESLRGPVNVTAPNPVTNTELTRALGAALHRPTLFTVPGALAKLAFGELAEGALLSGVRALPKKLLASGFQFEDRELLPFLTRELA